MSGACEIPQERAQAGRKVRGRLRGGAPLRLSGIEGRPRPRRGAEGRCPVRPRMGESRLEGDPGQPSQLLQACFTLPFFVAAVFNKLLVVRTPDLVRVFENFPPIPSIFVIFILFSFHE